MLRISAFTRVFDALWRCAADPGSMARSPSSGSRPLRCIVKNAAPRPGHEGLFALFPVELRASSQSVNHAHFKWREPRSSRWSRPMTPDWNAVRLDLLEID